MIINFIQEWSHSGLYELLNIKKKSKKVKYSGSRTAHIRRMTKHIVWLSVYKTGKGGYGKNYIFYLG